MPTNNTPRNRPIRTPTDNSSGCQNREFQQKFETFFCFGTDTTVNADTKIAKTTE
uniref:Uncharacterized protein n=1 Tax=Rhizophora mucronata TaxID=61149 RepID=A0A2P2PZ28_RHIMU